MSGSIGGVDASIPIQAGRGVEQINPLQQAGQFANTINAFNQLKLFPGQQQLQQQAVQRGAVGLADQINKTAYGAMAPLLALPPGAITHQALTTALASAEKNLGIPTGGVINDIMQTAPTGDGPDFDAKMRAMIAARGQTDSANAVGMVTPRTGPVIDTGPNLQLTTVAPAGAVTPGQLSGAGALGKGFAPTLLPTGGATVPLINGSPVGRAIPNTLTPGEATQPTQIGVDQRGAPIFSTREGYAALANQIQNGRYPAGLPQGLRNPNAPPSGIPMGVGPAQQAQMQTQGTQSAGAFQQIADQGMQAKGQGAILGNMLGDLKQFSSGQVTANDWKKFIQKYSPTIASAIGATPESVAANESFDKFANQIAGAQGERSDARLAVAQNANPNSTLSPAGADLIIRQLQGNADYLQARQRLAAQYPDQTNRAAFESDKSAQGAGALDPRAFQYDRMTPAQRRTYVAGLSPEDKKQVQAAYNHAHQLGLLGNAGQ